MLQSQLSRQIVLLSLLSLDPPRHQLPFRILYPQHQRLCKHLLRFSYRSSISLDTCSSSISCSCTDFSSYYTPRCRKRLWACSSSAATPPPACSLAARRCARSAHRRTLVVPRGPHGKRRAAHALYLQLCRSRQLSENTLRLPLSSRKRAPEPSHTQEPAAAAILSSSDTQVSTSAACHDCQLKNKQYGVDSTNKSCTRPVTRTHSIASYKQVDR